MGKSLSKLVVIAMALFALGQAAPAQGVELRVFCQVYTPNITVGESAKKLHEFARIAERFEKMHPGVKSPS